MASKRTTIDNDTLVQLNGVGGKVKESRQRKRAVTPFKKPNSDYYRLDLVVRNSVLNETTGHNVMVEDIKADYKAYLDSVRGTMSITKYIHNLIEQDMKRQHYKDLLSKK